MTRLEVVFHAPTAKALARARRNLVNFQAIEPEAKLQLIANGEAVAAALETADEATDARLFLCANSLQRLGLSNTRHLAEVDSAVVEIARLQAAGWQYIRA